MSSTQFALNAASKIYKEYYSLAIKEFGARDADKLARAPADYVYNTLLKNYPNNCYIDSQCCLEYCNEMVDSEFNTINPEIKKNIYEKAFGVSIGNTSMSEINLRIRSRRRKTGPKKIYYDNVGSLKENINTDLVSLMENTNITSPKRKMENQVDDLENIFKSVKL